MPIVLRNACERRSRPASARGVLGQVAAHMELFWQKVSTAPKRSEAVPVQDLRLVIRWRTEASAAMDSLDRCMARLRLQKVEPNGPGLGSPSPDAMPDSLLCVLRHECLKLGLGALMIEKSSPSITKEH
jgi:hypothetical protein